MAQMQLDKKTGTSPVAAKKTVKKAAGTAVASKKETVKKTAAQKPANKSGNGKTAAGQKQLDKKTGTSPAAARKAVKKSAISAVTKKTTVKKTAVKKSAGKNGNGKTAVSKKQKTVTFNCYSPDSGIVEVGGNFNNWTPEQTPMKKDKDGNWSVKLKLSAGCYQYKFVFDGTSWENDPTAPIVASEIAFNNILEVR
jgi:hypothetical protein